MQKLKRILLLILFWGIPIFLICVLPWRKEFQHQQTISNTKYVFNVIFWICVAFAITLKKWQHIVISVVLACIFALIKIIT